MKWRVPQNGDTRVRKRFLLFPKLMPIRSPRAKTVVDHIKEWRWLCFAQWTQHWTARTGLSGHKYMGWVDLAWDDIEYTDVSGSDEQRQKQV